MVGAKNSTAKNYETKDLVKPKVAPMAAHPAPTFEPNKESSLGRRRVPRRAFDGVVGVLALGEYVTERAYQIGEGGMMIGSSRPLVIGQNLVLSFYLPNSNPIVVHGVLRNIVPADNKNPIRYGLEFVKLNFQNKREIRNYVASAH